MASYFCTRMWQLPKFARDAVSYAESILDSVMGGLEGLINILDSEGGYGSLDNKVNLLKIFTCVIVKTVEL